jgi:hypothetical protein
MPDATHYTYRVAWSVEDGEHVAPRLPCSASRRWLRWRRTSMLTLSCGCTARRVGRGVWSRSRGTG